jgi:integrase
MKYKLIVCLELMSGSRISEILRLRKRDIVVKGDRVGLKIGVMKKRRSKERMLHRFGSLSPRVGKLLLGYVEGKSDDDLIFNLSRIKVWTMYRRMFDICPHALRHSFIIYCFEKRGMKIEEVVTKMLFSNMEMAMRYYNSRLELEDFDEFEDL